MRTLAACLLAAATLAAPARAAEPELSTDAKRMLAYGTLAVMTKVCGTTLTADQTAQINTGLEKAAQAQKDLTPAQFTEAMKAAGAQIGENKAQVCAAVTPEFVASSLVDAANGE